MEVLSMSADAMSAGRHHRGLFRSETENPNNIKSLIDLKILKVV
jgi:hypothetical protein